MYVGTGMFLLCVLNGLHCERVNNAAGDTTRDTGSKATYNQHLGLQTNYDTSNLNDDLSNTVPTSDESVKSINSETLVGHNPLWVDIDTDTDLDVPSGLEGGYPVYVTPPSFYKP